MGWEKLLLYIFIAASQLSKAAITLNPAFSKPKDIPRNPQTNQLPSLLSPLSFDIIYRIRADPTYFAKLTVQHSQSLNLHQISRPQNESFPEMFECSFFL